MRKACGGRLVHIWLFIFFCIFSTKIIRKIQILYRRELRDSRAPSSPYCDTRWCRLCSYQRRLCPSAWVGFSSSSVCLSVCLFVYPQHNSKTNDPKVFKHWDIVQVTWFWVERSKANVRVNSSTAWVWTLWVPSSLCLFGGLALSSGYCGPGA